MSDNDSDFGFNPLNDSMDEDFEIQNNGIDDDEEFDYSSCFNRNQQNEEDGEVEPRRKKIRIEYRYGTYINQYQ